MPGWLWRTPDVEGKWFKVSKSNNPTFIYSPKHWFRFTQIGVVSFGEECPSHGVYARVTEVKHWIQYMARGAEDSNCDKEIPYLPGNINNMYEKLKDPS